MRRKVGLCCMVFGILLLLMAGGFLIYNGLEARNAADASEKALSEVLEEISERKDELPVNSQEPENPPETMPVVEIDGYRYIGYLSIPALGLELPVMEDWDYAKLKLSPCRYYGSVFTDDFVIAGHNYERHFGTLHELKIGKEVRFTDMNGTVYLYKVCDMETLSSTDTEEMIVGEWDLSLYTCTPGGTRRVTVRCERMRKT